MGTYRKRFDIHCSFAKSTEELAPADLTLYHLVQKWTRLKSLLVSFQLAAVPRIQNLD